MLVSGSSAIVSPPLSRKIRVAAVAREDDKTLPARLTQKDHRLADMQAVVDSDFLAPLVVVVMTRELRKTAASCAVFRRVTDGYVHIVVAHGIGQFEKLLCHFVLALNADRQRCDADHLAEAPVREVAASLRLLDQLLDGLQQLCAHPVITSPFTVKSIV